MSVDLEHGFLLAPYWATTSGMTGRGRLTVTAQWVVNRRRFIGLGDGLLGRPTGRTTRP